ncbi:MAG TPA: DUF2262 domain-containing protein [Pyrinomonadaceae bacterium]|nr:DUF2262 domain-containing protein [Pyrinomonadaceae bacterium]
MEDATLEINGHAVRVLEGPYLHAEKPTAAAREFAAELIEQLDEMRLFAAQEYLGIYNDDWREEGDPVLSQQEFCSRLVEPSIVLYDEIGAATVYFETSDMFAGHSIEVMVDDGKIAHASLIG